MYGFVITTAGEAMLARAAAGEALVLDAVMVGRGVVESAAAAKALNTLIDPVAAATSTAPAVSGNQISMTVEYRNDLNGGLEAGFALSEFGISAHVGDDPAALLYYGSLGDAPQPVKPASEGLDVHRFPVAIAVTGEVSVTLEYPAGGFLTEEDIGGLNYIPTSEKGKPGGVATLGGDGKVSEEQLPKMDYDPAGSAAAVQQELTAHTDNKENPHGVTAEQVPYNNSVSGVAANNVQIAIDLTAASAKEAVEKINKLIGNDGIVNLTVTFSNGKSAGNISLNVTNGVTTNTFVTNGSGKAIITIPGGGTATVSLGKNYIDLENPSKSITAESGDVTNDSMTINLKDFTEITTSQNIVVSNACTRMDVCAVGGGGGGSGGDRGGAGGGGYVTLKEQFPFTPETVIPVVIGAGGKGSTTSTGSGYIGGTTTIGDVTAEGGKGGTASGGAGNGKGGYGTGSASDTKGKDGTVQGYSSFTETVLYGGGGGAGRNRSNSQGQGGAKYGGAGGTTSHIQGYSGKGPGGGGGSGAIDNNFNMGTGGDGYRGVITARFWH